MRTITAAVCLATLSSTSAFITPTLPATRTNTRTHTTTKMMLSPDDILTGTSNLLAIVKENDVFVKNAGEYPWGSVQAPDWALPVAAISTLSFGVLIPLFLKPGVDSFNAGGAKGAEKIAAASGKAPPTRAGAVKKVSTPAKPAAKGKVVAKGGVKAAGGKNAPAAAAPAPKKKGWF